MADSHEEKVQKVRTLYERTTNPGEKAAAYAALKRLLKTEETISVNWIEEGKKLLLSKGYYLCCAVGERYLYSRVNEKVWIEKLNGGKATWSYFQAATGKRFVLTDKRPDKTGTSIEQLSKII